MVNYSTTWMVDLKGRDGFIGVLGRGLASLSYPRYCYRIMKTEVVMEGEVEVEAWKVD
jgi:hypothetical protein